MAETMKTARDKRKYAYSKETPLPEQVQVGDLEMPHTHKLNETTPKLSEFNDPKNTHSGSSVKGMSTIKGKPQL